MAQFRVMRVGGKAIFASGVTAPPVIVVPPVTGTKPRFRVMRAPNGKALFLGAEAGSVVTPPVDPPVYVPKQYDETLNVLMALLYDSGNGQNFDDALVAGVALGFATSAGLEATDTLSATTLLDYGQVVQVQVEDRLIATTELHFVTRARLRGWNEDKELPAVEWKPEDKPNLF